MYHPVDDGAGIEYIELVNTSGREIDISEWAITGGVTFAFPRGTTVPDDGAVLVVQSMEAFLALHPGV